MKREDLQQLAERIHREEGDAIAGERVIGQARRINKIHVVRGTSRHRVMETVLKSNVLCVIDKSYRLAAEPFRLKSE